MDFLVEAAFVFSILASARGAVAVAGAIAESAVEGQTATMAEAVVDGELDVEAGGWNCLPPIGSGVLGELRR